MCVSSPLSYARGKLERLRSVALMTLALPVSVVGQAIALPGDTLRLIPSWDVALHQPRDATLIFALNRPMRAEDGRLVVIVGQSDLSAQTHINGTRVSLALHGERLVAGDLEVVTYVTSAPDHWRELGRFMFRRLTRTGFESATVRPKLDLQTDGQLGARLPPNTPPVVRDGVYHDLSLNGGWEAALRRGNTNFAAQGLLLGASREEARLRNAQMGGNAPAVDLASYSLQFTRQPLVVALGHVGLGTHRHLVNQFRSRGVSAQARLGTRLHATLAGVAGSEIVGWDDPLGLRRPSHRILSGSLGIEAAPTRPGLLRLELSALEGSQQPIPAFNQGAITDRQTSGGFGGQLNAALPSGRVRLSAGVARSRFSNPLDPLLNGDTTVVRVLPETRNARFGELTLDALRGVRIGPTSANLSLAARHERVDPQYKSVAMQLQANRQQNVIEAHGSLDALQVQFAVTQERDNLDDISSLLTTRSRGGSLNAVLPLPQLLRASPAAWWWPSLTVGWQTLSQIGDALPADGGFRFVFQVPNQRTSNLTLGVAWQRQGWNVAGRYNHSLVDNRQLERERSDFATDAYGVTLGLSVAQRLTLAIDLAREGMHNIELEQHMRNERVSFQADWRPAGHLALNGAGSLVTSRNPMTTQRARNTEFRIEASQGFNLYARPAGGSQARVFLRYVRAASALRMTGTLQPETQRWTVNSGLSLRVF
jgi:hypothetical protein